MLLRLLVLAVMASACNSTGPSPIDRVPIGTWGGDDAGLMVGDSESHVHIGCTLGTIEEPMRLDSRGRFDLSGIYNVDAFPVNRGIFHPARFTGQTSGRTLSLQVRLTDIDQTLGPVMLTFGRTPQMRACPICSTASFSYR